jgi:uncharacterized membrane protein
VKQLALTCLLLATAITPRAQEKPLFIELPPGTLTASVSSGGMVVGTLTTEGAYYWMSTTGVVYIGGTQGIAVSRDGRSIIGRARDARRREHAAIWQRGAEWRLLGSFTANAAACDDLLSGSFGASPDASIIVGLGWDGCNYAHGFSWRESTGMVDLGTTVPGRSTRANAVSGDGRIIVGWQDASTGLRQGARWVDGRQELFMGPNGVVGEAQDVTPDGSLIVGQTCNFINPLEQSAWTWTAATGVRCHPAPAVRPARNFIAIMTSTSDDGRVIGGAHSFGPDSDAVLWLDGEAVYLKDYLRNNGVSNAFNNWVNTGFISSVSPDGRIVVGHGAGPRDFQGYVVILGDLPARPKSEVR